jgi:hypothetical protein
MLTQEDIYKKLKSQLNPPEQEKGILPLLRLLASKSALPGAPSNGVTQPDESANPTSNAISTMIPDTGKMETNMQKNNLMSRYPGLGAK